MRLTTKHDIVAFQRSTGIDLGVRGTSPTAARTHFAPRRTKARRDPEAELLFFMQSRWGDKVVSSYKRAVPGRRFSLDIAFVEAKLAVEVDGWKYHGMHKKDFHRDREKRNLLVLHGWAVLAFSARDVFRDPYGLLDMIASVLERRM